MTTPTRPVRQPRGWLYRERIASMGPNLGTYQAACGHYIPVGTYACQDCNLAPLSEWLELRERLIEVTELLEGQPRLTKAEVKAIGKSRALLELLD